MQNTTPKAASSSGFSNRLLLLLVLVVLIPSLFFNLAFMSRFEKGGVTQSQVDDPLKHPKPAVADIDFDEKPKEYKKVPIIPKKEIPPQSKKPSKHPRNYTMNVQQYTCPKVEYMGRGDGGWATCITPNIDKNSVIYSFGLGNDPGFDLTFIKKYGPVVHAFDPTPTGENFYEQWENKPSEWVFHDWGLHKADENMTFLAPRGHDQFSIKNWDGKYNEEVRIVRQGYKLTTIMKLLGHKHVDVCKIDIEGSEWGIIDDLLSNKPDIDQLFFEFHFFDLDQTDHFSVQVTKYIEQLNSLGYLWFYRKNFRQLGKRYNPPGEYNYVEYSFIRPRKD